METYGIFEASSIYFNAICIFLQMDSTVLIQAIISNIRVRGIIQSSIAQRAGNATSRWFTDWLREDSNVLELHTDPREAAVSGKQETRSLSTCRSRAFRIHATADWMYRQVRVGLSRRKEEIFPRYGDGRLIEGINGDYFVMQAIDPTRPQKAIFRGCNCRSA